MRRVKRMAFLESRRSCSHQSVEISIDELVLYGFSAGDRYSIGDALEKDLSRLISQQAAGIFTADSHSRYINAGSVHFQIDDSSKVMGKQIANAVFSGLKEGT